MADGRQTIGALKASEGRRVVVELKTGARVSGELIAMDKFMNMRLKAIDGVVLVRGNQIIGVEMVV